MKIATQIVLCTVLIGATARVLAQGVPAAPVRPLGHGPAVGGSGGPVLTNNQLVRSPPARITALRIVYEDFSVFAPVGGQKLPPGGTRDFPRIGERVVSLAPSIFEKYGVAVHAMSVKPDEISSLVDGTTLDSNTATLVVEDRGMQNSVRGNLKFELSLKDSDGHTLWTGTESGGFWGIKWGARDLYTTGQKSIVASALRLIANDLVKNQLIG